MPVLYSPTAYKQDGRVLALIWSKHCKHCAKLKPIFAQFEKEGLPVTTVDGGTKLVSWSKNGVSRYPTVCVLEQGWNKERGAERWDRQSSNSIPLTVSEQVQRFSLGKAVASLREKRVRKRKSRSFFKGQRCLLLGRRETGIFDRRRGVQKSLWLCSKRPALSVEKKTISTKKEEITK